MRHFNGVIVVFERQMVRYWRHKLRWLVALVTPLFFLLFLSVGLKHIQLPGIEENYLVFSAPGIILMTVLFHSMFTGVELIFERQFGFLKETLIAPIPRWEAILGKVLGGAVIGLIQGILMTFVAILAGMPIISFLGVIKAFFFLFLTGMASTAIGVAFAVKIHDTQGFVLIVNLVLFPLFFLSGALFPFTTAPWWLKFLVQLNPITYGVEGTRAALTGIQQIGFVNCALVLFFFTVVVVWFSAKMFETVEE
ncbi:ABC transporter permease [Candidatus Woesearchaeota archaeon]|nr:ABC transporter permease [Candidatus Woesearchaeota archaeon]